MNVRRRRKAALRMLEALFDEIPDDEEKSNDALTIEAFLWRQVGEYGLAKTVLSYRSTE